MNLSAKKLLARCKSAREAADGMTEDIVRLQKESEILRAADARGRRYRQTLDELNDLIEYYNLQVHDAEALSKYINQTIRRIPLKQGRILRLRYIRCASWTETAKASNYALSHCYQLHSEGLRALQRAIDADPPPSHIRRLFTEKRRRIL